MPAGFTLLELAAVVTIAGIILAVAAQLYGTYKKDLYVTTTAQRIDAINLAIQAYVTDNIRNPDHMLPCPADPTQLSTSASYGRTVTGGSNKCGPADGSGLPSTAGRAGFGNIIWGAVPVRDLNLDDSYIAEPSGNLFIYAVTQNLANWSTYTGGSQITGNTGASISLGPSTLVDAAQHFSTNVPPIVAGSTLEIFSGLGVTPGINPIPGVYPIVTPVGSATTLTTTTPFISAGNNATSISYQITIPGSPGSVDISLGAIEVKDQGGNSLLQPAGSAIYVVISPGQSGIGAYSLEGKPKPCGAPGSIYDIQNCTVAPGFFYSVPYGF